MMWKILAAGTELEGLVVLNTVPSGTADTALSRLLMI